MQFEWIMLYISVALAVAAGFIWMHERRNRNVALQNESGVYKKPRRIAILIACKDGELTIGQTVRAAKRNRRKVFVVSDGSSDKTARVAKKAGAEVLALRKNIGKPSALHRAYKHFKLSSRFDAVAILDDDVLIDKNFIAETKKSMKSDTAITVGQNITYWPDERRWNIWLAARAYSYWCYQVTLRRVQSHFNVMNCISGSNSLYRTEILDQVLSKNTPYIVDDTYWTLETHRLDLGRIVYAPAAKALIQDPTTLKDWYKQNLRWMWGTFQGVLGHKIGTEFNRFQLSYVALITEWVFYVLSGPLAIWLIFFTGSSIKHMILQLVTLMVGYGVWVAAAAISLKNYRLMWFVPVIVVIDFIFRWLMVHAFYKALRQRTVANCVWESPKRLSASLAS